jgi:hypothetical protein
MSLCGIPEAELLLEAGAVLLWELLEDGLDGYVLCEPLELGLELDGLALDGLVL